MSANGGILDKLRGGAINSSEKDGKDKLLSAIKIVLQESETTSSGEGTGAVDRQSNPWFDRRDMR